MPGPGKGSFRKNFEDDDSNDPVVLISLNPDDAESVGLIDNIYATVTKAETATFDYNGSTEPVPVIHFALKPDDPDRKEENVYWSAGSLDRMRPTEDGKAFRQSKGSSARGLSDTCNANVLMKSLANNGFPKAKLQTDITICEGMHALWNRVPQKERAFKNEPTVENGRAKTTLVPTIIDRLPWESQVNKGLSPAAKPGPIATPAAKPGNGATDLLQAANDAVVQALKDEDGPIALDRIGLRAFQTLAEDNPLKKEIVKFTRTPEFINQTNAPFVIDGNFVMLNE